MTAQTTTEMGYLSATEADHRANAFHDLGDTEPVTMSDLRVYFATIPTVPSQSETADAEWIIDLRDMNGDLLDDRLVSKETLLRLLGDDEAGLKRRRAGSMAAWAELAAAFDQRRAARRAGEGTQC